MSRLKCHLAACAALPLLSLSGSRALAQGVDCCDAVVNVGFAEASIRGQPPFMGIIGTGASCRADEGEIVILSATGATPAPKRIYPSIVSELPSTENVQGWSFGVLLEGTGTITGFDVAGTATASLTANPPGYRDTEGGSFHKSEVIDPAENGGKKGLVSAVALTQAGNPLSVLPSMGTESVLAIDVAPEGPQGDADQVNTLSYEPGLIGSGTGVALVVTVNGATALTCGSADPPWHAELDIIFRKSTVVDCCDAVVNVGFAESSIRSQPPFTGIIGTGESCTADEGQVIVLSGTGATPPPKRIYPSIISELAPTENVQGWSFGVLLEGTGTIAGFDIAGTATASLTANPPGYRDTEGGSFHKSEVIDPADNGGKKGLVSAVALTQAGNPLSVLPSMGTESVLGIDVAAGGPQGAEDQVNTLSYEPGLIGSGTGVALVVTVNGATALTCGSADPPWHASVDVVFRESSVSAFRRGFVNPDAKFDIADGVYIINYLVRSGPEPACLDAADVNDDGMVDVSDAMLAVFYLFQPSSSPNPDPAPQVPFATCGPDPTDDSVTCNQPPSVCP